ncbi:MAG: glycosyltransferase family 2 protein [Bacteroidales bacterium]|nr:glycosyltransferase family 2 protein [Bacteroidales bacterium]
MTWKVLFWCFLGIIVYTYLGYFILIYILFLIKKVFTNQSKEISTYEPDVTIFITAYNEADFVERKIQNTLELDYPKEKITQLWITDGSTDGTPNLVKKYPDIILHHQTERKGKVAAMNRGMQFVNSSIVIFSDGNTMLATDAVRKIVRLFSDTKTGCVAGEKRIKIDDKDKAISSGEGLYWKYESLIKKCESEINNVIGAAGELFAIRTELFEPVKEDTLLDDFIMSLTILKRGYAIKYDPGAYALESASFSVKEEFKRKVRIASGGIQSMIRMPELLNFFKYGFTSFQYLSHKVLRWILVPFAIPLTLIFNFIIIRSFLIGYTVYHIIFYLQLLFYLFGLLGWWFENKQIKVKLFFTPYYIIFMNFSMFVGIIRFFKGKQSVNWDRAKRGI